MTVVIDRAGVARGQIYDSRYAMVYRRKLNFGGSKSEHIYNIYNIATIILTACKISIRDASQRIVSNSIAYNGRLSFSLPSVMWRTSKMKYDEDVLFSEAEARQFDAAAVHVSYRLQGAQQLG